MQTNNIGDKSTITSSNTSEIKHPHSIDLKLAKLPNIKKIKEAISSLFQKFIKHPHNSLRHHQILQNTDHINSVALVESIVETKLSVPQIESNIISKDKILSILISRKFLIAEMHHDESTNTVILKNYHAAHASKGHDLLLKGKAVIVHEGGAIATHLEAKNKLLNQKIVLHDDPEAHPDIKELVAQLREQPLTFSYLNSESMEEFHSILMQGMMSAKVIHSEPQVKTTFQNVQKADSPYKKESLKGQQDPFAKIKEKLIIIFMNWYQQKVEIEKARAEKRKAEEKENQIELDRKDKKERLEKKEHREAEDKAVLAKKNEAQGAQLNRSAAEIDAKTIKRLRNRSPS